MASVSWAITAESPVGLWVAGVVPADRVGVVESARVTREPPGRVAPADPSPALLHAMTGLKSSTASPDRDSEAARLCAGVGILPLEFPSEHETEH